MAGLQVSTSPGLKKTIATIRLAVRLRGWRPRACSRWGPIVAVDGDNTLPRGALRTARAESQTRSAARDWARRGTGRYRPTYARVTNRDPPFESRQIWSPANGQVVPLYARDATRHTDTRAAWTPRTRVQRLRTVVGLAGHPHR